MFEVNCVAGVQRSVDAIKRGEANQHVYILCTTTAISESKHNQKRSVQKQ